MTTTARTTANLGSSVNGRAVALFVIGLFVSPAFACGSGNSECLAAGQAICRKACACNGGTTCRFLRPGVGATATKTEASCNEYFADACGTTAVEGMDFAKCAAEADRSTCVPNQNPLDGPAKAASLPDSCKGRTPAAPR